jgi:glutathionyl-hydroquinone reductase
MGILVNGKWLDDEKDRYHGKKGQFKRPDSPVRHWVTPDGSAGPSGDAGFKAEAGRYHLYVAINCPWAHRTIIYRKLKNLENVISMSFAKPVRGAEGWIFENGSEENKEHLFGKTYLHEVYTKSHSDYTGRVSVPMLWDKKQGCMVSNESSEIIRMLNTAFNEFTNDTTDYYPEELREEIDTINDVVYKKINNGVYKTGYARTQEAYEESVVPLFDTLDMLDDRLSSQRYLVSDRLTEADWRLFPTLIRFDAAYVGAFKCNVRQIKEYPHLAGYTRELFQVPGIADTVNIDAYKTGYYHKNKDRNPFGIVPIGPDVDFDAPHERDAL